MGSGWAVKTWNGSAKYIHTHMSYTYIYIVHIWGNKSNISKVYTYGGDERGGGLGSRPKKMYGERLGDGVEYHLMSPTPRR